MQKTGLGILTLLGALGFALSIVVHQFWQKFGWVPISLPIATAVALLVVALCLLPLGWQVRKIISRRPTWLRPADASLVAVAALAASRGAAFFLGIFLARALAFWTAGSSEFLRAEIITALATSGACLLLLASALVVEHWCIVPPDDDKSSGSKAVKTA